MRIAFLHNLPSGGARRASYYQLRGLRSFGHEIDEFLPESADIEFLGFKQFVNLRNIYPETIPNMYMGRVPLVTPYIHAFQGIAALKTHQRVMQQIAIDIDKGGYDVVLAADSQVMFCPYALRYLNTPSVFYCHDVRRPYKTTYNSIKDVFYFPAHFLFQTIYKADELKNSRKIITIITNSTFSVGCLQKLYKRSVKMIRYGIDTDVFRILNHKQENYALCVAAITKQKGYRFLIEALACVNENIRPSLFIAANFIDKYEKHILDQMAFDYNVKVQVETITDDKRLVEVYNSAKIFVYAPYNEALGLTPLEAMACGAPVVAVGEGGVAETVPNRDGGWLVNRDPDSFAQKLTEVLTGNAGANPQALRDYVIKNWSWGENLHQLEQILFDAAS